MLHSVDKLYPLSRGGLSSHTEETLTTETDGENIVRL